MLTQSVRRGRESPLAALARAHGRVGVALLVAGTAAAGIALRVYAYRSPISDLNSDEAVWGLMARAVLHGHVSAFYWSQNFGGTQEVLVVAFFFLVFGTHVFVMRLVPMLLAAASAVVVWRLGRRAAGEVPGLAAGLLVWVWPPYVIFKTEVWHGFYGSGLLYASLVLLFVVRLAESPTRRDIALFGLLLGLAFWQTEQIGAVAVPALLWLTVRRPRLWRSAWLAVPGLVLGALPWLLSNLRHDWWSFTLPPAGTSYGTRLHGFGTATLPELLGLRIPYSTHWLFGPVGAALYVAALAAFALIAWRRRLSPLSLFVVVLVLYPFIYASNGLTWLTGEPRYVLVATPAVAVLVASFATTRARVAAVVALTTVLSALVLVRWSDWQQASAKASTSQPISVDVRPAIAALERAGIDRAWAGYWIAYRMTFMTRERLVVAEADLGHLAAAGARRVVPPKPKTWRDSRHPAYDAETRSAPRHAYVLVTGDVDERRDAKLLTSHGYREEEIGTLRLFFSPSRS